MNKSKLIQFLSNFSKSELRQFKDFVHSPFFNKHKKTTELLDYILQSNNWQSNHLEMRKTYSVLFPNEKFDEQKLRTLMSYLVQLIFKFYIHNHNSSDSNEQQIRLLETTLPNGQKKLFEQTATSWKKQSLKFPLRNSNYFFQQSRYNRLMDTYDIKYGKRVSGNFLEEAISNFDTFYIAEKLRMTCEMLARKQVMGQKFSFLFLEEIIPFLEKEKEHFQTVPGVWIYLLIYKMMSEGDTQFFYQLKNRLERDSLFFSQEEGRDLYTHGLNYCIGKINVGESNFRKEAFELYRQMLSNDLLLVDGIFPQWDFINIVSLGCELNEINFVKNFIPNYKNQLANNERENISNFCLANFYYFQKYYEEAISLLQKIEFTEIYYSLLTRLLLVKIYFETQNWKALDSFLESFRIYILRNKQLDERRRKSGRNLIKYTRKLIVIEEQKGSFSKQEIEENLKQLKHQISITELVMNKSWLLSKCEF